MRLYLVCMSTMMILGAASSARAECVVAADAVFVEAERLRVVGEIRFDLYGPTLDPTSLPVIDAVGRRLRACPDVRIEIQVHTDTRRTEAFNTRSSSAIAGLIRDRLLAQGVSPDQVVACGYGESRPASVVGREPWDPANTRVEWIRVRDARAHRCPAL